MTTHIRLSSAIAIVCQASVAALALSACGKQQSGQSEVARAQPQAMTAEALSPPEFNQQLQDRLGKLEAMQGAQGWTVALPSARFAAGQEAFEPADPARIEQIASLLKERSDVQVIVQAFTDSRGSDSTNLKVSQGRADAVRKALLDRGVDAARVRSEGRGEDQPVASNDSAEGREQNRRVEIVFSDAQGRFAAADQAHSAG